MKEEFERVRTLLVDTVSLLCKNGLTYGNELRVEGVIGITVDRDVFIVHVNEVYDGDATTSESMAITETASAVLNRLQSQPKVLSQSQPGSKHSTSAAGTSSQTSGARKASSSSSSTLVQVKKEPVSTTSRQDLSGRSSEEATGRVDGTSAGFNSAGQSGSRDISSEVVPYQGSMVPYQGGNRQRQDSDVVVVNDDEYNDNDDYHDDEVGYDDAGVKQEYYDYEDDEMGEQEGEREQDWTGYDDSGEPSGTWESAHGTSDNMTPSYAGMLQRHQHRGGGRPRAPICSISRPLHRLTSSPSATWRLPGNSSWSEGRSSSSSAAAAAAWSDLPVTPRSVPRAGSRRGAGTGRRKAVATVSSVPEDLSVDGAAAGFMNAKTKNSGGFSYGQLTVTNYVCNICGAQYKHQCNLLTHQVRIHGREKKKNMGRKPKALTDQPFKYETSSSSNAAAQEFVEYE